MNETIDLTMTWTEWARIYAHLAEGGERQATIKVRADLYRMAATAQAMVELRPMLTQEQEAKLAEVLVRELRKVA